MEGACTALEPGQLKVRRIEVDLGPFQADQLAHPEAMPIADQDHGCVAVALPVLAGRLHQPLDFTRCKVLALAIFSVGKALWSFNCSVLVGWRLSSKSRFGHV